MPRIAIGEISHETNTFCAPTTLEMFKRRMWCRGDEVIDKMRGVRTYLGGMIEAGERLKVTLVPTFAASTEPWGTITREAYDAMVGELLDGLRGAMPLDAVCLGLHGAGVADGITDLESAVLEAVRGVVGPATPIAVTLDLHGNITPRTVELATGLFCVHEYPHTDAFERGQEAMEFLVDVLSSKVRPAMAIEVLPLMIPASTTRLEPAKSINDMCFQWEREPRLMHCTFIHGFVQTDIPEVAVTVVAVADGDQALAQRAVRSIAKEIWAKRDAFQAKFPEPEEAVAQAVMAAVAGGPVIVNELSDNPGGGAPGDGTHLLRAMLDAKLTDSVFGTLYDPETAAAAHQAGVGRTIPVRLGAKTDTMHGAPIETEAYVKALTDGKFRLSTPMGRGMLVDLGRMARLTCGGLDIIVASDRTQVLDPEPFLLHGIDVTRCRIVGLKSSHHFRAGYDQLAKAIITTDPPGLSTSRLTRFPYKRVRRPIYPLDADTLYGEM
jgi:microcystin degradation protein MlrC